MIEWEGVYITSKGTESSLITSSLARSMEQNYSTGTTGGKT